MSSIRILILGDYPAVRAELRNRLDLEEGFDVVGEGTAAEALTLAAALQPDLLLVDLDAAPRQMDGAQGDLNLMETLWQVKCQYPRMAVFALSIDDFPAGFRPVFTAVVDRSFTKGSGTGQLAECIRNFRFEYERKLEMEQIGTIRTNALSREKPPPLPRRGGLRFPYIDGIAQSLW